MADDLIADIKLELLQNGSVIKDTVSTFDGYYSFEYLKPRNYTVQVSPLYHDKLNPLSIIAPMKSSDLLFSDASFHISKKDVQAIEEIIIVHEVNNTISPLVNGKSSVLEKKWNVHLYSIK